MRKRGLGMLCLTVMISALVVAVIFCVLIFTNKELFRFRGDLIETIFVTILIVVAVSSFFAIVLMNSDRKAQLNALLNGDNAANTCPQCHMNLANDCHCCPNCKTILKR